MAVKPLIRATLIAAGMLSAGFATTLPAHSQELAALSVPAPRAEVALPSVLSTQDVKLYRQIFEVQEKGNWRTADKLIKQLSDRTLMGHVMAQRYLHPTKYRSKYKELKAWMADYNDHHYAKQIYKLALKRRPKNWKYPAKPKVGRALYNAPNSKSAVDKPKRKHLTRSQRRRVATLKNMLKSYLRKGHTLSAKRLVQSGEVKKLFDAYNMDWAIARLAKGYFMDGRDDWAVQWAEKATKRSGKYLPSAHWIAGLAYWRLGNMDKSAEHFELSAKYDTSSWTHSASAFWAARAYLIARKPEKVMPLLENAASYPRTFYGMLANKLLGQEPEFNWALPPMDGTEVEALMNHKGGKRALALLQVGENSLAEKEMRQTARLAPKKLANGMLSIAAHTGMAELTMRLDSMLYPNGGGFDGASYPLPSWQPADGFKIDRALIYALVRQESRFNPKAKSGAGARGLMQLMPGTASFVARDRTFRWNKRSKLFEPELNLKLGQKYIGMLLGDQKIKGDLFLMAAAWNGGPGNLNKWRRRVNDMDDSLFFIESLPSRETRIFIERVLTNLWIYRNRLGQDAPSLDAVASGAWPSYAPQGQEAKANTQEVATNVQN
ncbi:MAG: lytic transglycosylase domain-containing protein [Magnetovibrio sp.]|nr:lytic transglycosylase domain-containing protein [Magnetovibrio sp.]